jgi:hypothetical protein
MRLSDTGRFEYVRGKVEEIHFRKLWISANKKVYSVWQDDEKLAPRRPPSECDSSSSDDEPVDSENTTENEYDEENSPTADHFLE